MRAQDLRSVYNERLDAESFLDLMNWIEGELGRPNAEIRASAALMALRDWARDEVAYPALRRYLEAGRRGRDARRDGPDPQARSPSSPATT